MMKPNVLDPGLMATVLYAMLVCLRWCQGAEPRTHGKERLSSLFRDTGTTMAYDYVNLEDEYLYAYSTSVPYGTAGSGDDEPPRPRPAPPSLPNICDKPEPHPFNNSDLVW